MIENTEYREWWRGVTNIREMILALLDDRDAHVRAVARELAQEGVIAVTQKGKRLSPDAEWRGPVRLTHPRGE